MARTSYICMRCWWCCQLCTRPIRRVGFYSASSLKQRSAGRHVATLIHIILIPSKPVFCSYYCVLTRDATNTNCMVFGLDRCSNPRSVGLEASTITITRKEKEQTMNYKKLTHKTNDCRAKRTPLKTRGELKCSESISRSCSTCGIRRVTFVTYYLMMSHEWGMLTLQVTGIKNT
jgi:hypothetical protein